jgi:hypothetical protein
MAKMYPYPVDVFNCPSEELMYKKLMELGPEYTVLYSRRWKNVVKGENPEPECDFIITKNDGGIIDLEVKGGRWEKRDGNWFVYGEPVAADDNPFLQGLKNKVYLLALLKNTPRWKTVWFPVDYAVALPDTVSNHQVHEGDVEILAMENMDYIQESVESLMQSCIQRNYPSKCSQQMIDYLVETLLRDYVVYLNDILVSDEKRLLVLTQKQMELDRNLQNLKRLTIQGCAGSGKTLMAIKQVKRLAKQPGIESILFTCFNLELGEWLKQNTQDIAHKCTTIPILELFKQKAIEYGRLTGIETEDSQYYIDLVDKFLDVIAEVSIKYDAIVVDEGQSFKNDWWSILELMLSDKEKGYFYVFFDDLQRIYAEKVNIVPGEEQAIDLLVNLRNTARIHRQATKFLPKDRLPDCNNIEGECVWLSFYDSENQMKKILRRYLEKLIIKGRVSSKDIIILTPKGADKTKLKTDETFGGVRLSYFESDQPEKVRFTSIPKYRGMERQVVILVEIDENIHDIEKNIYLGASRAKTKLIMLVSDKLNGDMKKILSEGCEVYLGKTTLESL